MALLGPVRFTEAEKLILVRGLERLEADIEALRLRLTADIIFFQDRAIKRRQNAYKR
jgi:hypothetical protein